MESIVLNKEQVRGEIYKMTNTDTGKVYVGQTVSHRKNHAKYRRFGIIGRFKDHISEAMCNTKKHQCNYLNSAIRKYGVEKFTVELIEVCSVTEMDEREAHYIVVLNSLYPNGYNLTKGGKTIENIKVSRDITNLAGKRGGCKYRSSETRSKMSAALKSYAENDETRKMRSDNTRSQHMSNKIKLFEGVEINSSNLDSYITRRKALILVKVGNRTTRFAGKRYTIDELYNQAIEFLKCLHSATLPNCSGTP